jgi:hypothetical protein
MIFGAVADAAQGATPSALPSLSDGAVTAVASDSPSLKEIQTVATPVALCTCAIDASRPTKRLRLNYNGASVIYFLLLLTLPTHNPDRFHLLLPPPLSRRTSQWECWDV